MATAKYLTQHLGPTEAQEADPRPTDLSRGDDINRVPRPSLSLCNLFSGAYEQNRQGGLTRAARAFGWDKVTEIDNDSKLGGGW